MSEAGSKTDSKEHSCSIMPLHCCWSPSSCHVMHHVVLSRSCGCTAAGHQYVEQQDHSPYPSAQQQSAAALGPHWLPAYVLTASTCSTCPCCHCWCVLLPLETDYYWRRCRGCWFSCCWGWLVGTKLSSSFKAAVTWPLLRGLPLLATANPATAQSKAKTVCALTDQDQAMLLGWSSATCCPVRQDEPAGSESQQQNNGYERHCYAHGRTCLAQGAVPQASACIGVT